MLNNDIQLGQKVVQVSTGHVKYENILQYSLLSYSCYIARDRLSQGLASPLEEVLLTARAASRARGGRLLDLGDVGAGGSGAARGGLLARPLLLLELLEGGLLRGGLGLGGDSLLLQLAAG